MDQDLENKLTDLEASVLLLVKEYNEIAKENKHLKRMACLVIDQTSKLDFFEPEDEEIYDVDWCKWGGYGTKVKVEPPELDEMVSGWFPSMFC